MDGWIDGRRRREGGKEKGRGDNGNEGKMDGEVREKGVKGRCRRKKRREKRGGEEEAFPVPRILMR